MFSLQFTAPDIRLPGISQTSILKVHEFEKQTNLRPAGAESVQVVQRKGD
jgi:hypothetical protein